MNNPAMDKLPVAKAKPQVTFALFAYNQEKYIRQAVEGAFAQTYSPLEIILSDDQSTDDTFEIMLEMAASYGGPHHVRLNRNAHNMGIVRHVFRVASMSDAEYMVVAAGDDISKPCRTDELVRMFKNPNVLGVCSGYDVIDEDGVVIRKGCLAPDKNRMSCYFRLNHPENYVVLQGSTSAYRREIFFDLKDMETGYAEDNFLNFYIYANGGVVEQTPGSLVLYRQHASAVHHRIKTMKNPQDSEGTSYADSQIAMKKIKAFKAILVFASAGHLVDEQAIDEDLRQCRIVSAWPEKNFFGRLNSAVKEIFFHQSRFLKWQAARLLGRFPNYQPKVFLAENFKIRF